MVTHRPVNGLSRSWLNGVAPASRPRNLAPHNLAPRVDGDVRAVPIGEGRAAPVAPPLHEIETRGRGQRIELRRGRVTDRERTQTDARLADLDVLAPHHLQFRVVASGGEDSGC